ncbi:MAG: hypothetical protein ACKVU4_09380 [Phycisphaerales bacterium]
MAAGPSRSTSAPRSALAGASVVFVLGLLVAASVEPLRPWARELHRETLPERAAVRELSAALAKAVRGLVASGAHKPVAHALFAAPSLESRLVEVFTNRVVGVGSLPPPRHLRRLELIAMPPPVIG